VLAIRSIALKFGLANWARIAALETGKGQFPSSGRISPCP
jgi:hypothetical protein